MTEPETAEIEQPRKRGKKSAPAESDGKRAVGHWVAKLPDGRISMNSSEIAALRDACPVGSVAFVAWSQELPAPGEEWDVTKPVPDRGFWIGRHPYGDKRWAGFEREIGARHYALPDGAAQFVRNGETISL